MSGARSGERGGGDSPLLARARARAWVKPPSVQILVVSSKYLSIIITTGSSFTLHAYPIIRKLVNLLK